MRQATFIDTSYLLALVNSRDKYHLAAINLSDQILPPFVTSDAVLFELGNALANPPIRALGVRVLHQVRLDKDIEIVSIGSDLFAETVAFYRARPDKGWGLTDCSSFVIMQRLGLVAALTADKHFEQAGFTRLLSLS